MWKKSWQRLNIYLSNATHVYPRPIWLRVPRWLLIHWRYSLIATFICVPILIGIIVLPKPSLPIITILYSILRYLSFSTLFVLFFLVLGVGAWFIGEYTKEGNSASSIIVSLYKDQENEHLAKAQCEAVEKQLLSGITLRHTMRGHKYLVNMIAWSPDGKMLASGSDDWNIHIWDVDTGRILRVLEGHKGDVNSVTWSPDGHLLASASRDKDVRIWNPKAGQPIQTLTHHTDRVLCVAWSPDGRFLASGSEDSTVRIWNPETDQTLQQLDRYSSEVYHLAWSPDGHLLASASVDSAVRIWNPETGQPIQTLTHHTDSVCCVAWSSDGRLLASGSKDKTIRIWDMQTGQQTHILEEHTGTIRHISFSAGSLLLASLSEDDTVRLWRTDTWTAVTIIDQPIIPGRQFTRLVAFHPKEPVLVTLGADETTINIWDLDLITLLSTTTTPSARYKNAKVILVGDSGVGKSGLSLALTDQPFTPTESTHARHVWNFASQDIELDEGRAETRETLLWDLAGQPGYRLIHQLYLNEVAVALVVFDTRSETDPFAGVYHWDRALRLAQRIQGSGSQGMKKFLIAARVDRGGIGVSKARINVLISEMGFDGFFETSAKDGRNITDLKDAIIEAIEWDSLPTVHSTTLFQRIKAFLVTEKEAGRLLSTVDDLYRTFLRSDSTIEQTENLLAQFETCIGRLESRDLLRRLRFGNLVLLQPEVLDVYASALVFDVFLCYNIDDRAAVKEIGNNLKEQGLLPWLDEWELRPGLPWQRTLERQIGQIKTVAVFVGKDGLGPWQQMEIEAFLREFVKRGCPVMPVLLDNAPQQPQLPIFLNGMTWIDFHVQDPDPMQRLIWGITGERREHYISKY